MSCLQPAKPCSARAEPSSAKGTKGTGNDKQRAAKPCNAIQYERLERYINMIQLQSIYNTNIIKKKK